MELRHLRQITEICRVGSFSGAAQRLGVSQPTLSKSIAGLEAQLSVKLFDRDSGAARPTVYGRYIAERAESLLRAEAALRQGVEQLARGDGGTLRIGVGPITKLRPLPEVIGKLTQQFPNLRIETHQEEVDTVMRSLGAGRYDLAFCYAEGAEQYGNLMRIKIFEDRKIAAVRPGHPLLDEPAISPALLLKYPMAGFPVDPALRRWVGDVSPECICNLEAFISDDHELIKRRPIQSDYFAFGPAFLFFTEFRNGHLVELENLSLPKYECWMVATKAFMRSPIAKLIAEIAQSTTSNGRITSATAAGEPLSRRRRLSAA